MFRNMRHMIGAHRVTSLSSWDEVAIKIVLIRAKNRGPYEVG